MSRSVTEDAPPVQTSRSGRADLEQFLHTIWPDGFLSQWCLFWGAPSKQSHWVNCINDELLDHLLTWAQTEDVYIGCGLRGENLGPNKRGTREAVTAIPGLWLDVDFADATHRKPNLPPTEEDARQLIVDMGPAPTMVIHTGGGLQAWWCFREPWFLDSEDERGKAERFTKGWCDTLRAKAKAHGWDVDQVGDLPRVMRLPGTWNHKAATRRPAVLQSYDAALRFNLDDLEINLPADWSEKPKDRVALNWKLTKRPDAEPPSVKFHLLCENDPDFKRLCLRIPCQGQDDKSPSGFDFQLARLAFTASWSGQEVVNLLIAQRRAHKAALKLEHPTYYELTLSAAIREKDEETRKQLVDGLKAGAAMSSDTVHMNGQQRVFDPNAGLVKELADIILTTDHFARDGGGLLYVFEKGVYRPHGDERIRRRVKQILEQKRKSDKWSSHRGREVAEWIRLDALPLWERPPMHVLNLSNGLLDISTCTLNPHTPDHLTSVQLCVTYDQAATCPEWERFVARVFTEDSRSLAYEIPAYLMRPDMEQQKAVLCIGKGSNGKSTYLKALTAFLGRENVAGLSLQKLEVDKFSVVRLLGKLANICADLPSDHLTSTSTFKGLTGGDQLVAERKFQSSFEFYPFARLVFSANHYPQSKDSSEAFFRRWIVIPFEASITPAERVSDIDARLSRPRELSGLLNRALESLKGMMTRGGFTQNETTLAAGREFRDMTDPVAAWLDQYTAAIPEGIVTKKDLLIAYNGATEASGRPLMSSKSFYASVKQLRPTITEAQRRVNGDVQWVFLGLALSQVSRHSRLSSEISLA